MGAARALRGDDEAPRARGRGTPIGAPRLAGFTFPCLAAGLVLDLVGDLVLVLGLGLVAGSDGCFVPDWVRPRGLVLDLDLALASSAGLALPLALSPLFDADLLLRPATTSHLSMAAPQPSVPLWFLRTTMMEGTSTSTPRHWGNMPLAARGVGGQT